MTGEDRNGTKLDDVGKFVPRTDVGTTPVSRLLAEKRRKGAVTTGPKATVYEALRLMAEHDIGALVVVEGGRVAGMISERDYARKVILIGKASRETAVEEIMERPAVTVAPETTVAECMALMTKRFLRHLPVLERGALVGLVSIGDVVKAMLADQGELLERIEAYISGRYPA